MNILRTLAILSTGIAVSGLLYSCSNNHTNRTSHTNQSKNNNDSISVFDQYSTKIDGVIDEFRQGATNDCWLLSELNGLSHKSWGKNIISKAIISDGMGGAIVTIYENEFEQKQFRITEEEITTIRNKQKYGENVQDFKYSTGDADVLALELAIEKYFKTKGDDIDAFKMKDRSLADLVQLLAGNSERATFKAPNESSYIVNNYIQLLDIIEKYPDKYVTTVGFKEDNEAGLIDNHAYELKEIKKAKCGHKIVTLIDPHDNSKDINIDYYTFLSSMKHIKCNTKPEEPMKKFEQIYYEDFNEKVAKYKFNKEHSVCNVSM